MSWKKAKPNQHKKSTDPDNGNAQNRPEKRHVYIDPSFKVDLVQDLKEEIKTTNTDTTTHNRKQLYWSKWTALGSIVASIVIAWQGYITYRSNITSRESLTSVQRAFLSVKEIPQRRTVVGRAAIAGSEEAKHLNDRPLDHGWLFSIAVENSGVTPAQYVSAAGFHAVREDGEPPDNAFPSKFVESLDTFTMAPKETQVFHIWYPIEEDKLLGSELGDDLFANWSKIRVNDKFYVWGWILYKDVFSDTSVHVTEFCRHFNGITKEPQAGKDAFAMHFEMCKKHNCTDEYCPDYKEVVAAFKSKK